MDVVCEKKAVPTKTVRLMELCLVECERFVVEVYED